MKRSTIGLILAAVFSNAADACSMRHMSFEEAVANSDAVVVGTVLATRAPVKSRDGTGYEYSVDIKSVKKGSLPHGRTSLVYFIPNAREMTFNLNGEEGRGYACFMMPGSGFEETLEKKKRYRFWISTEAGSYGSAEAQIMWAKPY